MEMPYGKLCEPLANICTKHALVYYLLHTKHKMATESLPAPAGGNKLPSPLTDGKTGPTCAPCSLISENAVKNVAALSQCFLSVVNKRRLDGKGGEPSTCLGGIWSRSGSQATLLLRTVTPQLVSMYSLQRHRCRYCIYFVTEGYVYILTLL